MTFRSLLVLLASLLVWAAEPSSAWAVDEDAKKAQEEISHMGTKWMVEWTRGTIQYKLQMNLSGRSDEIIGELSGEGVIRVKDKTVRISVSVQLTAGKFGYITKYPAMTFTYVGRMVSSDPAVFPVKEAISFQDSLLLKDGALCPLSVRQGANCLKPQAK